MIIVLSMLYLVDADFYFLSHFVENNWPVLLIQIRITAIKFHEALLQDNHYENTVILLV